jgi:hypothetical protein
VDVKRAADFYAQGRSLREIGARPEVARAAKALANQVRTSGSKHRKQLFQGKLPRLAEQYLAHAIDMQWVVLTDDDRIAPWCCEPGADDTSS